MKLTPEIVRSLMTYDPETGIFTWLVNKGRAIGVAGCISHGYVAIRVQSRRYQAHRLAWLYVHGMWPRGDIDHINGVRSDNRIANLREATRAENQQNRAISGTNTSGHPGVTYDKSRGKWKAHIRQMGVTLNLGRFDCAEAAGLAYLEAKARVHTFCPSVRP